MNIHEYQAKQVLAGYGASVPVGHPAFSLEEALEKANLLFAAGSKVVVVKAQIHAGGRGKAGGVKVVKNPEDAARAATEILGKTLVTHQTGPEGKVVQRLYIESGCAIAKEYYVSFVLDRDTSSVVIIASADGGVEIEEVAKSNPEKILRAVINPKSGLSDFHIRKISFALQIPAESAKSFSTNLKALYCAFIGKDMMQLEVNPFVLTDKSEFICLDAKVNIDENALYRNPDIAAMRDETEEDELENEAAKFGLSYIKMSGNIGCMVNGAGLAMATMDTIQIYGGKPANFLDVGGGANKEKVTAAFKIIVADPEVKVILVNIFGGIMRCDIIAEGVLAAVKEVGLKIPLVVRLAGTNVDLGKKIIADSSLNVIVADNLAEGAKLAVAALKQQ